MPLEDHVGDVLRKARAARELSVDSLARGAGMAPLQLQTLEDTGQLPIRPDWSALAKPLGLDAAKLERIAAGWGPRESDLSVWRELRVISTSGDGFSVNSYLIWDEVTRDAALFDTGWSAEPAFELLDQNGLVLRHLFITHSHADHIAALQPVRDRHPKVKLHSSSKHAPPEQRNRANDFIHLGSLRITNRDTPGHADDGVTYVIGNWPEDAPPVAIVGDALFAGSMGKAIGEAAVLARRKVQEQILSLPPDTLLCPGHGPLTTVAEETANNPFFS